MLYYWNSSARTLEPAFVPAQSPLDALRRPIGTGISVAVERIRFEHHAGIQVDHAFGAKPEALFADGDVPGKAAIEEFGRRLRNTRVDPRTQLLADIHVLTGDPKRHLALPSPPRAR